MGPSVKMSTGMSPPQHNNQLLHSAAVSSLRSSIGAEASEGMEAAAPTGAMTRDTSRWGRGRPEVQPGSQNQPCKVRIGREQGQTPA